MASILGSGSVHHQGRRRMVGLHPVHRRLNVRQMRASPTRGLTGRKSHGSVSGSLQVLQLTST
jgi:hypothetical protein